ncbi:MAG: cupin [Bacteroidota bacterium]
MSNSEIEKSKSFVLNKALDYISGSIIIKTIIKKPTGTVTISAFDKGEVLTGKVSQFDTLVQVVEGSVELLLNSESHFLESGEAIIIPAHTANIFKATDRFKMITITIKSGYEEVL